MCIIGHIGPPSWRPCGQVACFYLFKVTPCQLTFLVDVICERSLIAFHTFQISLMLYRWINHYCLNQDQDSTDIFEREPFSVSFEYWSVTPGAMKQVVLMGVHTKPTGESVVLMGVHTKPTGETMVLSGVHTKPTGTSVVLIGVHTTVSQLSRGGGGRGHQDIMCLSYVKTSLVDVVTLISLSTCALMSITLRESGHQTQEEK